MRTADGKPDFLYDEKACVVALEYEGLDMDGLRIANARFGSERYGDAEIDGACSITFAKYFDGTIGAVRNMDLHLSNYCSYELFIRPGQNVRYPTWALAYTGIDTREYDEIVRKGVSAEQYAAAPFTATDAMSFGRDDAGNKAALYCAILMRSDEQDENGNYIWTCSGTHPGAPVRCCTQSAATLIAAQCVTIEQALAYVGAVDEQYKRLTPDVAPTLDVYTFNIETPVMSNHWFEVIAMEDASGRHGVLEFIENRAIWHENAAYSFNFFLQKEYLYNPDGSFRETGGAGLGRCAATVPYLDRVHTVSDHLALMDGIRYSHMTYYNEDLGYVGYNWFGQPVDWRSEITHLDPWHSVAHFRSLGLDTAAADAKYPLWARYRNTETGELERVDSFEQWEQNREHLKPVYTMQYVMAEENRAEVLNYIRWSGLLFDGLTDEQVCATHCGWQTYFRVIANPMRLRVTRWFNEDPTTADTVTWEQMNQ